MPSVIWERGDKYIIFSYENFQKQFSYVQIVDLFGGNKAKDKVTKRWLDSPRKRTCPGIKFWPSTVAIDPDDPENKLFNTWRGWATKPVENKALCRIILMDGCLLLHLEEAEWAKYNRYANKLRNLFTTPTVEREIGYRVSKENKRDIRLP